MSSRGSVKTRPSSATRPTIARFEERRKAGRRRRLVKAAIAGLLAAAVFLAVWGVWFSSWFAVTKVQVIGTHRLSVAAIEEAAAVPLGRPILRVDTSVIRRHVAALTVVSSVTVTTEWPHTVRIVVVERRPTAVVRVLGGSYRLLDATGVDIGGVSDRPAGMPLLSMDVGTSTRSALAAAASVAGSLTPALAARVRWVSALTPDSVVLELTSGATVRWGDSSQGAVKAQVLLALMKRQARVYDVSAPYAPTTARG